MAKYIDADRLKAEIERRKDIYIGHALCLKETNLIDGFDEALNIIESLQQEQPEVDLKKEIRSMWKKCEPIDEGMGVESTYMHIEAFDIIARYFYELGKNSK